MPDTTTAFVTRPHTNGDHSYAEGAIVREMPVAQLADLESVGLVRAATAEEIGAANQADATPVAPLLLTEPAPADDETAQ